jgi:hypothetical protein
VTSGVQDVTHARRREPGINEVSAGADANTSPTPRAAASPRVTLTALLLIVNAPIAIATVRGLARGWLPLGDNGFLLVRARNVGTSSHPLLGPWTSASAVVGEQINNPGPLYYDLLAPWVRLLGPWVGLAVGVMLVNMAASSLAVVVARRLGGQVATLAVAAAVAGLQFAMGSELLFDVWQPNALVLPFLAFLVVAVAASAGDQMMLPWLVGLGSLVVQTHLSHAVIVAVTSVVAILACARCAAHRREPVAWRRPIIWSVGVGLVAWCQPVIEQFTGPGEGNLTRLVRAMSNSDAATMGVRRGMRIVAELLVGSPWFTRGAYSDAFAQAEGDPLDAAIGPVPGAAVIVTVVAALGVAALWHARRNRPGLAALTAVAGIAVVGAVMAIATSPIAVIGVSSHQMRWAWVVAALAWAALMSVPLTLALPAEGAPRTGFRLLRSRVVLGATAGSLALVAVANLPTHHGGAPGPDLDYAARPALRELVEEVGVLAGRGVILFDPTGLRYADPYAYPILASLEERGIPFVFDDEVLIRQFGEGRRNDGSGDMRLWQVEGNEALEVPAGAERVALARGPAGPIAVFVEPVD